MEFRLEEAADERRRLVPECQKRCAICGGGVRNAGMSTSSPLDHIMVSGSGSCTLDSSAGTWSSASDELLSGLADDAMLFRASSDGAVMLYRADKEHRVGRAKCMSHCKRTMNE